MVQKFSSIFVILALLAQLACSNPIPDEQDQPKIEEITSFFHNLGQELQTAYGEVKKFFDDVAMWFENLGENIKDVYFKIAKFFDDVANWFTKAYADTSEFFKTVQGALGYGNVHDVVKRHVQLIPGVEDQPKIEEITSFFHNLGQELQTAYGVVKKFFDDVALWFENLGENIKDVYFKIANFFDEVANWFTKAYADTSNFFKTVQEALG